MGITGCGKRRAAAIALAVAAAATACGTRVETTATPETILVERSVGASPDATGGSPGSADSTTTTARPAAGADASGDVDAGPTPPDATPAPDNEVQAAERCPDGVGGEPIRLGAVGSQSGIVGAALENGFRGLAVWQEWVNANDGVQCRPVDVTFVDDGADPGKHAAAIRRLIRETGVIAFVGNIAPFTFSAGAPLLEDDQVPALGGEAADAAWFRSPMAFPINGQTISRSRPAAKWALANLAPRKAAAIYVNEGGAPERMAANFVDEWKRQGGEIVLSAGVSLVTPDFTGEVIEAKSRGAEIIYLVLEKSACTRWFNAQRRQGYRPIVLSTACTIDNARDAKDLLADRFYALHASRPAYAPDTPAEAEMLEAIDRYDPSLDPDGAAPDGAFMFGWLAGKLFEEATAQDGAELTGPGVVEALHRLPATTLGGLIPEQAWPPGPHPEGVCGMVSSFDGEQYHLVTPEFVC